MVQAAQPEAATFFADPEGAQTVVGNIEKNEDNQFELPIIAKEDISHDTILLRFGFPNPEWTIGIPVANHLKIFSKVVVIQIEAYQVMLP